MEPSTSESILKMGATTFMTRSVGSSAKEAFKKAVTAAREDHGDDGYTGTIAEKESFVMIDVPSDVEPHAYAEELLDEFVARVYEKWGPAGCIRLSQDQFLFFGWASS